MILRLEKTVLELSLDLKRGSDHKFILDLIRTEGVRVGPWT